MKLEQVVTSCEMLLASAWNELRQALKGGEEFEDALDGVADRFCLTSKGVAMLRERYERSQT